MKKTLVVFAVASVALGNASLAHATIGLPDFEGCSSISSCLQIQNVNSQGTAGQFSASTSNGTGLFSSGNTGLQATGHQYGVNGYGATGVGVYGYANPGYVGVQGEINPGSGGGAGTAVLGSNKNKSGWAMYSDGDFAVTGTPYCSSRTTFSILSDERLKKNIRPLGGALETLLRLRGVTFQWKDPLEHQGDAGMQRGFIAQEVEKVLPEWVNPDRRGFKTLNTTGIEPLIVESLRTLKKENEELRQRLSVLERMRPNTAAGFGGSDSLPGLLLGGAALAITILRGRRRLGAER